MASVLSASAWVMLARGVVGPRIDTGEESCPAPTSPTRPCSTNWPPPQQRCEVAAALRNVAETFAGCQTVGTGVHAPDACLHARLRLTGADPVLVLSAGRAASHSGASNVCTEARGSGSKDPFRDDGGGRT